MAAVVRTRLSAAKILHSGMLTVAELLHKLTMRMVISPRSLVFYKLLCYLNVFSF